MKSTTERLVQCLTEWRGLFHSADQSLNRVDNYVECNVTKRLEPISDGVERSAIRRLLNLLFPLLEVDAHTLQRVVSVTAQALEECAEDSSCGGKDMPEVSEALDTIFDPALHIAVVATLAGPFIEPAHERAETSSHVLEGLGTNHADVLEAG